MIYQEMNEVLAHLLLGRQGHITAANDVKYHSFTVADGNLGIEGGQVQ